MTVSAQNPSAAYTANGITTSFVLPAKVLASSDLKVYLDNVLQVGGYTVSGIGDESGVSVNFSSAPVSGAIVVLSRELQIVRTTDYPFGGNLSSDVLDLDQDRQTMILQQIASDVERSLTGPAGYNISYELPAPNPGYLLGWNISGTEIENKSPAGGGGGGDVVTENYTTLRALAAASDGDIVNVLGYAAQGDGGGGEFVYSASSSDADNNGTVIKPNAVSGPGRWKRRQDNAFTNIKWFGAVGNGVADDTAEQNAARSIVISKGGGGMVEYPPGSYLVNGKYRNGGITYLDSAWPTDFVEQQRSAVQVLNVTNNSEPTAAFASLSISGTVIPSTRANFVANANQDMVGTSSWVLRGGSGNNFMEAANFGAWFENNASQTWVVEIDCNNEGSNKALGDQTAGVGIMLATGSTYSPDTAVQIIRSTGAGSGPGWQRGLAIQGCRQAGIRIEAMDSTTYPSLSPAAPGTITALEILKSSDSVSRFITDQDGSMSWGPGNAARDVSLSRSGASTMTLGGALAVTGNLTAGNFQTTGNTWSSAMTPQSGSFTTASITMSKNVRMGKVIFFTIYYNITTVGTASGYITFYLPTVCTADAIGAFSGNNAGGALLAYFNSGSTNEIRVSTYNSGSPCVTGNGTISGWYLSNT